MRSRSKLREYRADHKDMSTRNRNAIVEAGQELFFKQGIASTTIGQIADRAGVSRVTVYRHFPECGAIAFEVYDLMFEHIVETIQDQMPSGATGLAAARHALEAPISAYPTLESAFLLCAAFNSFYATEACSEELEEWYRARQFRDLAEVCTPFFDSQLDPRTSRQVTTLADTVMSKLCHLAISGTSTSQERNGGPADAQKSLSDFKELILGHFDTVIAPNA